MTTPLLLIVDDSRTSRMLIRGLIAQLRPDWRLVEAGNGDEALAAVEAEVPKHGTTDFAGLRTAAQPLQKRRLGINVLTRLVGLDFEYLHVFMGNFHIS